MSETKEHKHVYMYIMYILYTWTRGIDLLNLIVLSVHWTYIQLVYWTFKKVSVHPLGQ